MQCFKWLAKFSSYAVGSFGCSCVLSIFIDCRVLDITGRFLTGASAAAGIALINSVGNLGGYVGPFGIGLLKEYTGNMAAGLYFLSIVMLLA